MELLYYGVDVAYIFIVTGGFSSDPRKKYYHKLLETKIFLFHFGTALLVAITGLVFLHTAILLSPAISLICLLFFNMRIKQILGRNMYLMIKGDFHPADRKWYEALLAIAIFLISMLIPIALDHFFCN